MITLFHKGVYQSNWTEREWNLVEAMTNFDDKFILYEGNENTRPIHRVSIGLYFGNEHYVWLGNNGIGSPEKGMIDGMFYLDRENKRVLFFPCDAFSPRESIVASHNSLYSGKNSLADVLRELESNSFQFYQATRLFGRQFYEGMEREDILKFGAGSEIMREFFNATGKNGHESFQINGLTTLKDILSGTRLPMVPLDSDIDRYLKRLRVDWSPISK
ncbi:MAG TPA: hypothetical protein VI564_09230 [Candidatus Nanoarchaeia archaeon]|nr:hypothetical protein [Candidatus Nanoarchaeia archaeon]